MSPPTTPRPCSDSVGNPVVMALLVAKASIAAEQGVRLRLDVGEVAGAASDGDEPLLGETIDTRVLVTVIGNLVDNAIDAVAGKPAAEVHLHMGRDQAGMLRITVSDNGPGLPDPSLVFCDGYTTKSSAAVTGRGLGLALVHGLVTRAGGTVAAHNDHGAVFEVALPEAAAPTAVEVGRA